MNKKYIWETAMNQSAIDLNCSLDDFLNDGNKVVISKLNEGRKKCFKNAFFCGLAYYGAGLVASVDLKIKDFMEQFISKHPGYRCFDTPQLNVLNSEFAKYGKTVCFIAEFFLPDVDNKIIINNSANIDIKIFSEKEVSDLYDDDRFHMALSYNSDEEKKDILAVAGYIDGEIVGVAAASNDSETMWQIGVDVLPKHRRLGIASTLTIVLTEEILKLGKVPFYCTAWSNIASKNNAIKCGYKTAWVEMTAIDTDTAMEMIGEYI